jgi:hypothetical protein
MDTKTVDIPPLPKATWIVDRQGMLGVIYIAFGGKGFFFLADICGCEALIHCLYNPINLMPKMYKTLYPRYA